MKWTTTLQSSLEKELHYVLSIITQPVVIRFPNGEEKKYFPPARVKISPNFYRSVSCRMCQKCCMSFAKIWTDNEFTALKKLYPEQVKQAHWEEFSIDINPHTLEGWTTKFHVILPDKKVKCPFLTRKGCGVHDFNPVHCRTPLIKMKQLRHNQTVITKESFGRNWSFGCPVTFKSLTKDEFTKWDLTVLDRIRMLAEDLRVPTRIEWIKRELARNFPKILNHTSILEL